MDIVIIGIDLGKNSCSLAATGASGRGVLRRRLRWSSLGNFARGLGRCIIAMEACCGAHHPMRPVRGVDVFAGMIGNGDQTLVAAGGEDIGRFAIFDCSIEVGHHAVVVRRIVAVRFRL